RQDRPAWRLSSGARLDSHDEVKHVKASQRADLLKKLKARFENNMGRHKGLDWAKLQAKLEANADKLSSLYEMERTGGEPDVVGYDKKTGEYVFFDCSAQTPKD